MRLSGFKKGIAPPSAGQKAGICYVTWTNLQKVLPWASWDQSAKGALVQDSLLLDLIAKPTAECLQGSFKNIDNHVLPCRHFRDS